jgi:hypothetical protein
MWTTIVFTSPIIVVHLKDVVEVGLLTLRLGRLKKQFSELVAEEVHATDSIRAISDQYIIDKNISKI